MAEAEQRDPVKTFCVEGQAFIARHPDLNDTQQSFGGLTWGLMRALAECDECPGVFRTPQDPDWNTLVCPSCHGVWRRRTEATP